jgi:hypothetical protein
MSKPLPTNIAWSLRDILGREVYLVEIPMVQQERLISLAGLADGLYFWKVASEGRQLGSGKLIVLR